MNKSSFLICLGILSWLQICAAGETTRINPRFNRDVNLNSSIQIPEANRENCANSALFSECLDRIMKDSENAQTAKMHLDRLAKYEEQCELIKKEVRAEQKAQRMVDRAKLLKEREERKRKEYNLQSQRSEKLNKNRSRDLDL